MNLEEYVSRPDVVLICAVQNSNGRWRRQVMFTLPAAVRAWRRATRNGHPAYLYTAELAATAEHVPALVQAVRQTEEVTA